MSSGILNISNEPMENCIFNYVLETNSPLITGGEASVISIVAYLIFIVLAARLLRKNQIRRRYEYRPLSLFTAVFIKSMKR